MKLKISKDKYGSLTEEQKELLHTAFFFNGTDRAWYAKIGEEENGMKQAAALGLYPTVFYLPTREEYASLTDSQKDRLRRLFEWNNKIIGWESKADCEGDARKLMEEGGLPGAYSYSLEETMQSQLLHGVEAIKSSEAFQKYLDSMSRFTQYSVSNMILIASQNPDATLVGGRETWKKQGRYINDSATGILIRAPYIRKVQEPDPTPDDPDHTTEKNVVCGYFPVKVFDLSETHGKPLPEPPLPLLLKENVEHYEALLSSIQVAAKPYTFTFEPLSQANGLCNFAKKQITVSSTLPPAQTIKTSFHETAHAKLHDPDSAGEDAKLSRPLREVQAESAAYICCKHYGLDSSDYSYSYIATWSPPDTEQVIKVLEAAALQAHKICEVVDQELSARLQITEEEQKTQEEQEAQEMPEAPIDQEMQQTVQMQ